MNSATNPKSLNIPSDAAQYLSEAASQIAKEQGFKPQSQEDMGIWLSANMKLIAERASALQWALLDKVAFQKDAVSKVMSAKVWSEIRRQDINAEENRALSQFL